MLSVKRNIEVSSREDLIREWNHLVQIMREADAELDLELFGALVNVYGRMRRRGIPVNSGLAELLARDAFTFDSSDGTALVGKRGVR